MSKPEPTDEGKSRYPPDGYYKLGAYPFENQAQWEPCTCKPECDEPCKGECGCEGCHWSYQDYLSQI